MVGSIPGEGGGPLLLMLRQHGTRLRLLARAQHVPDSFFGGHTTEEQPGSQNQGPWPSFGQALKGKPGTRAFSGDVREASDVLLPLDRAAVVLGLRHHPIDRTEGQHAREGDRCRPTHGHEEPIEGRLANVAEGEEEVPHLDGRLSGCEYRSAPERMSGSRAKADGDDENRPLCW